MTDEHDHDHGDAADDVDASEWLRHAQTLTCPACGAAGALTLGGGVFCPTCGEVTKNPGYERQDYRPRD